MKLLPKIIPNRKQSEAEQRTEIYRSLMREEAEMGGKLFGPIPAGHRREFFCLDEHTWVWHEEWIDQQGKHVVTTRYDIRPQGILKSQGNSSYQMVKGDELTNLYRAARLYRDKLYESIYNRPVAA